MYGPLYAIALNVVIALEQLTGMTMVILERGGSIVQFRDNAAAAICERTGDDFCGEDLEFISATSAGEGWSLIMSYKDDNDETKTICLLLPPSPQLSSTYLTHAMAQEGKVLVADELPTDNQGHAFLMMHWAARCLDRNGSLQEEQRADAFSTMALALIEGDPLFTRYSEETPARKFAQVRNANAINTAVDHAERWMMDIWKDEAARALRSTECQAQVVPSNNKRVSQIPRDGSASACFREEQRGQASWDMNYVTNPIAPITETIIVPNGRAPVTDGNLHLWMYGEPRNEIARKERNGHPSNPIVGAPPEEWSPFKGFQNTREAVRFIWTSASSIAGLPS